jgi:hypothetical protein
MRATFMPTSGRDDFRATRRVTRVAAVLPQSQPQF